ncbi:hypothetical protein ABW19_dt0205656 [Dactylella cylindrospora]|nr:hypothetical protein ABW19_dt0205656 [Dactylella cylindrospora]
MAADSAFTSIMDGALLADPERRSGFRRTLTSDDILEAAAITPWAPLLFKFLLESSLDTATQQQSDIERTVKVCLKNSLQYLSGPPLPEEYFCLLFTFLNNVTVAYTAHPNQLRDLEAIGKYRWKLVANIEDSPQKDQVRDLLAKLEPAPDIRPSTIFGFHDDGPVPAPVLPS